MLRSGDILELPLLANYGYGYIKYLRSQSIWNNKNIPDIVRVYNYRSQTSVTNIEQLILGDNLLIPPVGISGTKQIKKLGWKIVGHEDINENDKFLPYVKAKWPPFSDSNRWVYYENLGETMSIEYASHKEVRHLEYSRLLNVNILPFKITLEFMKLDGKDIRAEIGELNWLEEIEYEQSNDIPPYSKQKLDIRGRLNNRKK